MTGSAYVLCRCVLWMQVFDKNSIVKTIRREYSALDSASIEATHMGASSFAGKLNPSAALVHRARGRPDTTKRSTKSLWRINKRHVILTATQCIDPTNRGLGFVSHGSRTCVRRFERTFALGAVLVSAYSTGQDGWELKYDSSLLSTIE